MPPSPNLPAISKCATCLPVIRHPGRRPPPRARPRSFGRGGDRWLGRRHPCRLRPTYRRSRSALPVCLSSVIPAVGRLRGQDLDLSVEVAIDGLVDDTHAAFAQLTGDLEVRYLFACHPSSRPSAASAGKT